jgi:uncharacterized protein (TIGR02611 family)
MPSAEPTIGHLDALEAEVRSDVHEAQRRDHPLMKRLHRARAWVAGRRAWNIAYRVGVSILGGIMVMGGLVLVPLPGPGWLIVFLGLAVLGTEFHWARRISRWLKRMLDRFWTLWRAWRAQRAERVAALREEKSRRAQQSTPTTKDRRATVRPEADAA